MLGSLLGEGPGTRRRLGNFKTLEATVGGSWRERGTGKLPSLKRKTSRKRSHTNRENICFPLGCALRIPNRWSQTI